MRTDLVLGVYQLIRLCEFCSGNYKGENICFEELDWAQFTWKQSSRHELGFSKATDSPIKSLLNVTFQSD